MKRRLTEANDSSDGMLPVNINKIRRVDLNLLRSEEELFGVCDISNPGAIGTLARMMENVIAEYSPTSSFPDVVSRLRLYFNRAGYDFEPTPDRLAAVASEGEGFVDFPLYARTGANGIGISTWNDGITKKLGYGLVLRLHYINAFMDDSLVRSLTGEIVPQDI